MTDNMPKNPTLSGSFTTGQALKFGTVLFISNPKLAFAFFLQLFTPIILQYFILGPDGTDLLG